MFTKVSAHQVLNISLIRFHYYFGWSPLQFAMLSSLTKWMKTKAGLRHYNVACLGNKREINCKRSSNHTAMAKPELSCPVERAIDETNNKNQVQICNQSPWYVQQAIQSHEYDTKSGPHPQPSAGSG